MHTSKALMAMTVVTASVTSCMAIVGNVPARATIEQDPTPVAKNEVGGQQLASRGIVVHSPHGARPLPRVPASAYVIADATTGSVLAAKDAHGLFPPASTLKVLTAITMLPRLRPNATVLATKRAASVEPNIVGLIPGQRYKVADLFHALLLISANDAAVALAQAAGSFSKGIALMNAEAHHLQAYDVVAKQPNGLPAKGQVVSAYDLALIARHALAMPAFMKYDSMRTASFPVKPHKHVLLVNQNYLITKYRGGLGGKIGWTLKAGATYIGMARRHGVTLIVTILHATPLTEITSAEKLLNWGFAMSGDVRPVGVLVPPLVTAKPAAKASKKSAFANATSLAATSAGSGDRAAIGAGVAAGVCACVLGGLAWLRRRALLGRRRSG
ncbi:MAG TPA: D-alanyl-D-alanine carboxypeptidase [Streptosporangiaceae bacterium]|nr:D-alanyl-D-alanine carboxypeptidase [Streptosporangiaceae bacterium]